MLMFVKVLRISKNWKYIFSFFGVHSCDPIHLLFIFFSFKMNGSQLSPGGDHTSEEEDRYSIVSDVLCVRTVCTVYTVCSV